MQTYKFRAIVTSESVALLKQFREQLADAAFLGDYDAVFVPSYYAPTGHKFYVTLSVVSPFSLSKAIKDFKEIHAVYARDINYVTQ